MVRLVFRPYAQVGRTICTSVPRRTSTRVSPGFILLRHSSPSFGSYRICSTRIIPKNNRAVGTPISGNTTKASVFDNVHFHFAVGFLNPLTCIYERLPGPCFKTGERQPFGQLHLERESSRRNPEPQVDLHVVQYLNLNI